MERLYKIRKGLDLPLKGEAALNLQRIDLSSEYAIAPADFHGIVPRLIVKEGEHVSAGDTLFTDKAADSIKIVAPASGTVTRIERGARRKLRYIHIEADDVQTYRDFGKVNIDKDTPENILKKLLDSGLFAFFKQRPYDVTASPTDKPKGIFISAFSKMPLAADFSFVVKGNETDFKSGLKMLSRLAPVHLGISPEQINTPILPNEAEVTVFSGPNPAGNVGVQINHVAPVNKGEIAWTLDPEVVIMIGCLARTGQTHHSRRNAKAGSRIENPEYAEVLIGAPLRDILAGKTDITAPHQRIINGNPLVGYKSTPDDFLGAFSREVCVIPEGDDVHETFGWIAPRLNDFSTSRSYFSWLSGKSHKFDLDCRIKGGERHMIMSGEYERVFPMDIYPSYLIKAIITGDIDKQEELGIYEVAPEDFAVAEFIDSSKLELQRIVREGLDLLRKENS